MDFDRGTSTFSRTGSFKEHSMTEKLQDTTNINNNVNAPVTALTNNTPNNPLSATTVININNNISTGYNRKGTNVGFRRNSVTPTKVIRRRYVGRNLRRFDFIMSRRECYRKFSCTKNTKNQHPSDRETARYRVTAAEAKFVSRFVALEPRFSFQEATISEDKRFTIEPRKNQIAQSRIFARFAKTQCADPPDENSR